MIALAATLFFAHPAPLDMPRAEAYLVREADGTARLEDRFNVLDLWTSRAVLGRWEDDEGRVLTVSRLDVLPPATADVTKTRAGYLADRVVISKKETGLRDLAIARLSPFELPEDPVKPRMDVRGFKDVSYLQGTNTTAVVCTFLPEGSESWYLAVWELVEGDEPAVATETFENGFLREWEGIVAENLRSELRPSGRKAGRSEKSALPERELLRADSRHSVTNYTAWHVTDGAEFSVLDDLPSAETFVTELTNEFSRMRRRYGEVMPGPLDGSNVLCVARIYRDRDEYLDAVDEDLRWSAAYWSPLRRELVAYLPAGGRDELRKTIRHEAFHQYLSYATAMIASSPWLNEGYAQYFEDERSSDWAVGDGVELDFEALAVLLPAVMQLDYDGFYAGTDLERRLKYRLAWSIAYFLENGAPKVRFDPFRNLKRDYLRELVRTKDMRKATEAAFGSPENLRLFVAEWKRFWQERGG